jgi:hypothetical protein
MSTVTTTLTSRAPATSAQPGKPPLGHRVANSALAVIVAAVALVGPPAELDEASHSARGFSRAQEALIEWAIGRFADAGLELPRLEFVHYPTTEPCRGARGFYTGDRSRATIRICVRAASPFAELLFLHEIAHAWDRYTLTDRRRAAFLQLRDLEEWWDNGSAPWHTYGAEQAAQIVAWGLIDRPIHVATIPDSDCLDLRTGYFLLIGRPPLHGYADPCDEAA